jgi:sugar (pentulose or hexulose) kinase
MTSSGMHSSSVLLALDIGTTHCKAGVFDLNGKTLRIAKRSMQTQQIPGYAITFDPAMLWRNIEDVVREVTSAVQARVLAVGITSMAESILIVDQTTGEARSPILPWFDTSTQVEAERMAAEDDALQFYQKTGMQMRFKCTPPKLLFLKERHPEVFEGAESPVWLGASDYVVYQLTGAAVTDYSLAGRSGAFDINTHQWDTDWLRRWNLDVEWFPQAWPSGTTLGTTLPEWERIGIPAGTPVAIGGHDHLCAAFGASAVNPETIFDSMGTAEVLIGSFQQRPLTETDYASGLSSGCHVTSDYTYWFGSMSTSGGSIEWIRQLFNRETMSYDEFMGLLTQAKLSPTGILFLPHLLGSGAPHSDSRMRGAWVGLKRQHGRADLAKAVLEGTAFEAEIMRRAGEAMTGQPIQMLTAAGGGTRNPTWMQIKADVCGCPIRIFPEPEAALIGAARAATEGSGIPCDFTPTDSVFIEPDMQRNKLYQELFEEGYLPIYEPLSRFSHLPVLEAIDQLN